MDRFNIDVFSLESEIKSVINSPGIQNLLNDNTYYFQNLLDVKDYFFKFNINDDEINYLKAEYSNKRDEITYEDFVESFDGERRKFLEITGEFISYLDRNASGKNRWNKYEDNRTIAKAMVRQPHWVNHLFQLKLDSNHNPDKSIGNAFSYAVSPMKNLTVLSEDHRKLISKNILNKEYNSDTFTNSIIEFFKQFDLKPKNRMNLTLIISWVLYDKKIKSIWDPKTTIISVDIKKIDVFELYNEFLKNKSEEHTKGTIKSYCIAAKENISPIWKSYYGYDISEFKLNRLSILNLKRVTENSSSFSGKMSFNIFINDLLKQQKTMEPLNRIYYGPPGTGKTYKIITEYISNGEPETEEGDKSKEFVNEKKNFWHLAPGQNGYLWNELKDQEYLGYEWCEISLGDLKELDKTLKSHDIMTRLSKVKEGDYFCVISGKKLYGVAKALHDYDFEKSKESNFDFQTIKVEWIKQFDKPELLNTYSTQSFSKLNGSKRWSALIDALENQGIYFSSKQGDSPTKTLKNYSLVSFHQSFNYEDFIEGIKPDLFSGEEDSKSEELSYIIQDGVFKMACDKAANLAGYEDLNASLEDSKENRIDMFDSAKPYYLLIDEINRGNISSIFGELITLLEDDKRLGAENELILDLPYSKKSFGIPKNLYVVGTMNTADRSVEALDTALRRRFSFVEVKPDTKVLGNKHKTKGVITTSEGSTINLISLLDTINDRIELLLDKDHKIGHSYFFNVNDYVALVDTFINKVIPLLEEYFYGDFGKIGLVLGKSFVVKALKENKPKLASFDYEDKDILMERDLYRFTPYDSWNSKSFISIYESY
jgi:5-methylcytosine-specific restriction endonuclease McrBC GTP-binding regulatory subunit McrB